MESSEQNKVKRDEHVEDASVASVPNSQNTACGCGSGCGCNSVTGGKGFKNAICLLVLVLVIAVFAHKALSVNSSASNKPVAEKASVFLAAQTAPLSSDTAKKKASKNAPPAALAPKASDIMEASTDQSKTQSGTQTQAANAGIIIGEFLDSLSNLNKVALNQDAVFIFIPNEKHDAVPKPTNAAVLAAQNALKTNKITLGLYTLRASSPDYASISAQVQTPAILVAIKGKGISAVSGEVTETKLLQAFMASSRAGGCGPSGCGPSSAGCK